jgi:serine/threonine-protein kinase
VDAAVSAIGKYRILGKLGRGAMGVVYRAQADGGEPVALKVMAAELSSDAELVERFRREADAAAKLQHPNITRVLDFGESDKQLYMAMELLDGSDLKTLIEGSGAGGFHRQLSVMAQASAGMAFVHAGGFVHRDLKPANIHVKADGRVKIMDFGLVRPDDSNMTRTGMVMGSPSYMAPELIRGQKADTRSDVFALGAVYYELITGKRAFPGKGLTQIMMAIVSSDPEPLSATAPEVPAPVSSIVSRCLKKPLAERYQSAGEVHAAFEVACQVYGVTT